LNRIYADRNIQYGQRGGGFTANMEVGRGNPKSQEGEILHPAKGITIYIERR